MSDKKHKKNTLKASAIKENGPDKVKMRFKENKFYNNLDVPMFEKGKVYEMEGGDWIQRWLKRGGEIVSGELEMPKGDEPNPSLVVTPAEKPDDPSLVANDTPTGEDAQTDNEDIGE